MRVGEKAVKDRLWKSISNHSISYITHPHTWFRERDRERLRSLYIFTHTCTYLYTYPPHPRLLHTQVLYTLPAHEQRCGERELRETYGVRERDPRES